MTRKLQVGILGAGYMGQMHARLLAGMPGVRIAAPSIEDGLRSLEMVLGALASSARDGAVVKL